MIKEKRGSAEVQYSPGGKGGTETDKGRWESKCMEVGRVSLR